jgi:CheY-like chemotaxis protein/anti-anti-sigma regulatory factor
MKVAIIEDLNTPFQKELQTIVDDHGWDTDFFSDSEEFGRADLKAYDIVVVDDDLPHIKGRELIRGISDKTNAQIFLMCTDSFSEEDLENSSINGLINKNSMESIEDQFKYIDSKIRISKLSEIENEKMKSLSQNGHTFEIRNNVGILEIKELLTQYSLDRIRREIKESGVNKIVLYFSCKSILSAHLGILVYIYKYMKEAGGKVSFWPNNSNHAEELMITCRLDKIIKIYRDIEEALI